MALGPAQRRRPARTPAGRGGSRPVAGPPVVYGRVARIDPPYPREVRVTTPALTAVVAAAGIAGVVTAALRVPLGRPGRTGSRRGWKDLRKPPEFLVTPVLVNDAQDRLVPLEIHGHMSGAALVRGDRVRVRVRRSRDPATPPRAVHIENLTTGRTLTPRGATLWSHLGPGLVLQAALGLVLVGLTLACLLGRR